MRSRAVLLGVCFVVGVILSDPSDSVLALQRVIPPRTSNKTCTPQSHGASTGSADNAAAFQAAFEECQDGGTVFIRYVWLLYDICMSCMLGFFLDTSTEGLFS